MKKKPKVRLAPKGPRKRAHRRNKSIKRNGSRNIFGGGDFTTGFALGLLFASIIPDSFKVRVANLIGPYPIINRGSEDDGPCGAD